MSTSAINSAGRSRKVLKTAIVYLFVSAFCVGFDRVYAIFGHGVFSASMTFMFVYPLAGGALLFFVLWLFVNRADSIRGYRFFYNCHNSGIALLTVGSLLSGIFEIAGAHSGYLVAFTVCGWVMLAAGLSAFIFNLKKRR